MEGLSIDSISYLKYPEKEVDFDLSLSRGTEGGGKKKKKREGKK